MEPVSKFIYSNRLIVIFPVQVLIVLGAFWGAFLARFDLRVPDSYHSIILSLIPVLLTVKIITFWRMGLFKGWWRYVSMPDLVLVLKGNVLASGIFIAYAVFVHRLEMIPRSVLVLDGVFCFLLMGGVRFATRALRENYLPLSMRRKSGKRLLIIGAGDAGQSIAREIRSNQALTSSLVGFVDDDSMKSGALIQGSKVLGQVNDIPGLSEKFRIDEAIIAIPSATGRQVRTIVERCREAGVESRILPGVGEMIDGRVSLQQVRELNLEDLLGREAIRLDEKQVSSYLRGKRVLVTGAAGSIGSEICRQVLQFSPATLILLDHAETPVFQVDNELRAKWPDHDIVSLVGDVKNAERMRAIFEKYHPEVVFHAAAYKHVPLMEQNPSEAVNNNVGGTKVVADVSVSFKVDTFVLVSTDKAVRPTSIMGTTKRVAELYVQSLAEQAKTRFVTTRFGNVLGSAGSVIPTFVEQIKNGGPVTVTHPEVTRFFMTIPEATQLVLQAGSMGKGGEIFLFDMGDPVRIADLAEELVRLSGYEPHEDIEIVYSGLRPGEKLYEELLLDDEGVLPTHHKKICVAAAKTCDSERLGRDLTTLLAAARRIDQVAVRKALCRIVPEYYTLTPEPAPNGKVVPLRARNGNA